MRKTELSLHHVYGLLEPGPVVLLTTSMKGRNNIMTLSWHTMVEFEPPTVACVLGDGDYTFSILKKTRECVINIPTLELAPQVVACGNASGRGIDKFEQFGLTAKAANTVAAPIIDECYASLECKVVDTQLVNKYGMFILEVLKTWVDPSNKNPKTLHHRGNGVFMVAGDTIRLPSRMK